MTMTCSVCEITTRNPDNCGFASRAAQKCDAGSPGLPLNMLEEITSQQHGFGEVCHLCGAIPGDRKPLQTHCPKFLKIQSLFVLKTIRNAMLACLRNGEPTFRKSRGTSVRVHAEWNGANHQHGFGEAWLTMRRDASLWFRCTARILHGMRYSPARSPA